MLIIQFLRLTETVRYRMSILLIPMETGSLDLQEQCGLGATKFLGVIGGLESPCMTTLFLGRC